MVYFLFNIRNLKAFIFHFRFTSWFCLSVSMSIMMMLPFAVCPGHSLDHPSAATSMNLLFVARIPLALGQCAECNFRLDVYHIGDFCILNTTQVKCKLY